MSRHARTEALEDYRAGREREGKGKRSDQGLSAVALLCLGVGQETHSPKIMTGSAPPADGGVIYVPIAGSDAAVELPVASLPDDVDDVLDVLRAEDAPLALWRDVARAYLSRVRVWSVCGGVRVDAHTRALRGGCR